MYADVYDMGLKIEMICSEIRVKATQTSRQKALRQRQESRRLVNELDECAREMAQNPSEEEAARYQALQEK